MPLKILSWNIWYDGHFAEISKFLAEFKADIIGLQEVVPDDPERDTIGFLNNLGYQCVFAPVLIIKKDGRTMSNAIFSKFPIVASQTYILSETRSRNALRADIKIGETIWHVFCTHLLHTHQQPSEIQDQQAENLIKILPESMTIVMGDFNSTPDTAIVQNMKKIMTGDTMPLPTLNAPLFDCTSCDARAIPDTRLDYIFTSQDIKTHSFKVHSPMGSDHLPISVVID